MALNRRKLAYRYSQLNTESAKFLTYMLFVFNFIFVILGSLMLAVCMYSVLNDEHRTFIKDMNLHKYYTGIYILIAAGILNMVQTFFGVLGSYQKKSKFLLIFCLCVFACIVLELAGASMVISYGKSFSKADVYLRRTFLEMIAASNYDDDSKRILDNVQNYMGCCGADGIKDYIQWNKVVPDTCFNPINGNAWYIPNYGYMGCVRGFTLFLKPITSWSSGVAICLALLQVLALICSLALYGLKKDFKKSMNDLAG